jgi:hypothetical protein
MVDCIIMGWRTRRMGQQIAQEKIMLIVELNIVGYRFSSQVPSLGRKPFLPARFSPRAIRWRIPQLRQSQAV